MRRLRRLLGLEAAPPLLARSGRWASVRAHHLATEPECAACGGTDYLQVHHIYPVGWPGGLATELAPENLITLCEAPGRDCHLWWGHLGDWKSRNPDVREDAAAIRTKIAGRPYPPKP